MSANNSSSTPAPDVRTITLGKCHAQSCDDRYGQGAKVAIRDRERSASNEPTLGPEFPFQWPDLSTAPGEHPQHSIFSIIPSMQGNRNNLTALSQEYNLYFVAYQGWIFVYRPLSATTHALPRHPELQLKPAPSTPAAEYGSPHNPQKDHTINHIMTGYLGHEEILLACYDNGDVVAYYTAGVDRHSRENPLNPTTRTPGGEVDAVDKDTRKLIPIPFFHNNVGKSAWGLAIHKRSRLIAISSNNWEVTVFAFATEGPNPQVEIRDNTEAWVRQRGRHWRIVILLGPEANNIPNVCFLDDKRGFAEKICAIDIHGAVWIADIWRAKQPATRLASFDCKDTTSQEFFPSTSRGWGVIALPEASFMKVRTVDELIGIPLERVSAIARRNTRQNTQLQPFTDISDSLEAIPDNPCRPSKFTSSNTVTNRQQAPTMPLQDAIQNFIGQGGDGDPSELGNVNTADAGSDSGSDTGDILVLDADPADVPPDATVVFTGDDWADDASDELLSMNMDEEDDNVLEALMAAFGNDDEANEDEEEEGSSEEEESSTEEKESSGEEEEDSGEEEEDSGDDSEPEVIPPSVNVQGPSTNTMPVPQPATGITQAGQQFTTPAQNYPPLPPGASLPTAPIPHLPPALIPQPWHVHPPAHLNDSIDAVAFVNTISPLTVPFQPGLETPTNNVGAVGPPSFPDPYIPSPYLQSLLTGPLNDVQQTMLMAAQGQMAALAQAAAQSPNALGLTNIQAVALTQAAAHTAHTANAPLMSHAQAVAAARRRGRALALQRHSDIGQTRLAMIYYPHAGDARVEPMCMRTKRAFFMSKSRGFNQNSTKEQHGAERIAPGYRILRCYEKDFEMWHIPHSPTDNPLEIGIFCPNAVLCEHWKNPALNGPFWATSRLSFLAHIPELCLVALGSPTGRVLLATPTRLEVPLIHSETKVAWDHGIRVEWILPKESDEKAHDMMFRPLYGMAFGRIPDGSDEMGRDMLPKRYRLMLHYKNHWILSYEITRKTETGRLCVF